MAELIPISIVIGDRSYRIRILPKDEEVVRKTVKTINDKVIEFKTQFAGKDMQDYISMVLVWFATEQSATASNDIEKEGLLAKLNNLEKMLDTQLAE
ncbi:MAG: cell division protein ZapA [Bacteroidetes bacterium]|nr:cell division protein ZapA [Bacteroidota bacterium]